MLLRNAGEVSGCRENLTNSTFKANTKTLIFNTNHSIVSMWMVGFTENVAHTSYYI